MAADSIVRGLRAVADHFGRSLRTVQRWAKEGMPRLSGKRFDLIQVQAWLDLKDGKAPVGREASGDSRQPGLPAVDSGKDHWDKKAKEWQAKTRELEYRKLLGELVEIREVEQLFVDRIMAVKQGLLGLSRGLPPQLAHCRDEREMEVIINGAVRHLLEMFSRSLSESLGAKGSQPVAQVAE